MPLLEIIPEFVLNLICGAFNFYLFIYYLWPSSVSTVLVIRTRNDDITPVLAFLRLNVVDICFLTGFLSNNDSRERQKTETRWQKLQNRRFESEHDDRGEDSSEAGDTVASHHPPRTAPHHPAPPAPRVWVLRFLIYWRCKFGSFWQFLSRNVNASDGPAPVTTQHRCC